MVVVMYRLKYYSLTKNEKINLKNEFYQTEFGKSINKRLNRLFIIGVISLIFSIVLFITNTTIWDITTGILLLIAALIFIIGSFKVRITKLNNFLVKKKK